MKILTINAGSTSIKFKLYSMPKESVVAYGRVENIGQASPVLSFYSKKYSEGSRKVNIQ